MPKPHRLTVTLDAEHASKLANLAERALLPQATLARSLLSSALDQADPDPGHVADLLGRIPDAWERTQEGLAEAARGEEIAIDELHRPIDSAQ